MEYIIHHFRLLDLSKNVNNINFYKIVKFFQENKLDSNNKLIDIIKTENNELKLEHLINNYNNNTNLDYYSSGYIVELFHLFYNDYNFCIKENKTVSCILCGKTNIEELEEYTCFFKIKYRRF